MEAFDNMGCETNLMCQAGSDEGGSSAHGGIAQGVAINTNFVARLYG